MKFRAAIRTDSVIKEFVHTLDIFAKMSKALFFNIKEHEMTLSVVSDDHDSSPCFWTTLPGNTYFTTYGLDSATDEPSEVYILIESINLTQALAGLNKATNYLKLKLSDQPFTCIVIQTETPGQLANHKKRIEIPIYVVPRRMWSDFQLPTSCTYDLKVELTNVVLLRKMIGSMKHLSPDIDVMVDPNGSLSFSISDTEFDTKVAFEDLTVTVLNPNIETEDGTIRCRINSKRLGQLLTHNTFKRCQAVVSVKQDNLFRIEFVLRDGIFINYLMSALCTEQ